MKRLMGENAARHGGSGTLPRERLAPVGARGADALTWAWWLGISGLGVALAWWAWVAVRPLESPVPVAEAEVPAVTASSAQIGAEPDTGARQAMIESLGRENLFASDRRAWPRRRPAEGAERSLARTPGGTDKGAGSASGGTAGEIARAPGSVPELTTGFGAVIGEVTPGETLPEELKKALGALELKAVRRDREGRGVAMITFVHSADRPLSRAYRAGDEFKEETNPLAAWRVEAVEVSNRRVVLSRSGVLMALPLYKGLGERPRAPEVASAASGARAPGEVIVEGRTRDEVTLELRARGLSEGEIALLMNELDRQLDTTGESAVRALTAAIETAPVGEAGASAPRRVPPAGMEAVLKMMAEQSAQATRGEPAASSKKAPGVPKESGGGGSKPGA